MVFSSNRRVHHQAALPQPLIPSNYQTTSPAQHHGFLKYQTRSPSGCLTSTTPHQTIKLPARRNIMVFQVPDTLTTRQPYLNRASHQIIIHPYRVIKSPVQHNSVPRLATRHLAVNLPFPTNHPKPSYVPINY
eukprot:1150799-Pelagomonas_calceolata.AAC.5